MEARDQLTEEIDCDCIFETYYNQIKIDLHDLHYAGRESWVRWAEKNSQRVHEEVNCTKCFIWQAVGTQFFCLGIRKES